MGEANNLYNKVYPALPEIAKPDVGLAGKIPESAQVTPEPPKMNKKEVIASIRETVASFTKLREAGEGVGVGATMVQGTILTSGGIVAGVTAGGTVVAGAALAFPLTAAIAAVGVIVGVILRQTALNQELRVNLIMIKGEVERIYNIYKVMEEIAKEKQLPINTDMVKKFTIILTNNILLAAGPDTFEKIKVMSLGEGEALFQEESALGIKTINPKAMNNTRKGWWQRGFTFLKRTIIPMEVLRTLVRDITILTVFFTILQSEFDLLSREKEERQRIELFNALGSDSNLRLQPKTIEAFNNYLKPSEWINGDVYNTFKRQLPANSINIAINNASEGLQTQGAASEDPTQILVSTPTRGGRTRRQRSRRPRTQRKKQSKRRSYKYK